MNNRIIVLVTDNWKNTVIANIKDTIQNRHNIEHILEKLNKKYYGFNYFTCRNISIGG